MGIYRKRVDIMEDFYDMLYKDFKQHIIDNSTYNPQVYKTSPQTPPKFPVVEFKMMDSRVDNNNCSIDNLEFYYSVPFMITIYTQNIGSLDKSIVANELSKIINKYLMNLGMLKSSQEDIPNIDTTVLRRIITYESKIGNKNYSIRKI